MDKKNIVSLLLKYIKLVIGFFLCALGIVIIINANFGAAPWDVFHIGFAKTIGITMGVASIIVGATVIVLNIILGQPIGVGTFLNMILIGTFTDVIYGSAFIPIAEKIYTKIIMLFIGMVIFSYGTYLYIAQGKGCGPRDGLMQILNKRTNISVSIIKNSIELAALIIGWLLGGPIGFGTAIYALTIGFIVEFMFKIHHNPLRSIEHDSLKDELYLIKSFIK